MNAYRRVLRTPPGAAPSRASALLGSATATAGAPLPRSPAQLRLLSARASSLASSDKRPSPTYDQPLLRSPFLPSTINADQRPRIDSRPFHVSSQSQQKQPQPQGKAEPKAEAEAKAEEKPESEDKKPEEEASEGQDKEQKGKKEKAEDLPPPPPHGDKTPWQVFLETMNTELKESKEWNESTKALAAGAQEFSESEKVRKAREAYEATTGVVSSTASTVVKTTAGAIGKGASWTWETPVMKGVRKGANITGEALDKATKPIRETEAYRNVKNVIDDGSSSRYGGWVDKEERRKAREERERLQALNPQQNFEEDPE